ncbi:hypothetical protein WMF20_30240 [Sorangium sp. So ce834]|uniref:hypothetical protein n=1 Tax=Sorangium sp. So ce834 TaxID=3133321 RepID=UPI003F639AB1
MVHKGICRWKRRGMIVVLSGLVGPASGCVAGDGGSASEEGSLALRVSGEDAAKKGYPVLKNGRELAFVDGWTVTFDKFIVSLGDIELRGADGASAFKDESIYVADLHRGDPTIAVFEGLEARRWERFSLKTLPATPDAVNLNGVSQDDVERMASNGYNYWIEGAATKGGEAYTFSWGLVNPTRNSNCTNGLDGTDGFVVKSHATTEAEITVHVDHTFWDTLGSEVADLRFDAIAAAAGADGHIDFEELDAQRLSDLKGLGGGPLLDESGAPIVYNPGSIPLEARTLKHFVLAASASQAHINGLGLCTVSAL